ncbi:hypothetical protein C4D60_Mb00t16320 [Musa balbisiana]|uniref:Ribosomal protein S11 n=1 Tax=Musa balbisiana TaxID=52838 RepID=A0A4S8I602_MUSBA|nr:hypothetical protein C4D60_Mb00t16320 [Musa balbisiana]
MDVEYKRIIHVQAVSHTIVTVTDVRGRGGFLGLCWYFRIQRDKKRTLCCSSGGLNAIRTGMQRAEVMIKVLVSEEMRIRAIRRSGILLSFVRDVTPMPHNGCRPPKKRRV